ncbi:(2Fe-2S)-binding protein [Candidatus Eisenbacteria bacterium]|uniref:(2Fe-2S)-binding protein n=1 Tax=Eiseniibacteriota bacterium TaxID=2212470 RepID=A0ABV6YI73_UNCEI
MSINQQISFTLNGYPETVTIPVEMTTLSLLRDRLKLTGTKLGCGEGECGACTILVDGIAINSCLMLAVDCDGREVTTIEGVQTPEGLNILQQEFVDRGAVQCGFCTPGMIMQGIYLLKTDPAATLSEIRRGLEGNICRCTGYHKIVEATASALHKSKEQGLV